MPSQDKPATEKTARKLLREMRRARRADKSPTLPQPPKDENGR